MPSIRGSSNYRPIQGVTIYGPQGPTGNTGATGADKYGPTGGTAERYLTGLTLTNFRLISTFLNGTTFGASGSLRGITGDTIIRFDGRTASNGGTVAFFVGATGSERVIEIRNIKGSTGYRSYVEVTGDSNMLYVNVERNDGELTLTSIPGTLNSQLIATDSSLNFIGITSGFYGENTDIIEINKVNVFEKTDIVSAHTTTGTEINVFIKPNLLDNRQSKPKIYAVDLNQILSTVIVKVIIDPPTQDSTAFSLYVQGGRMPCGYSLPVFSSPGSSVVFPFNLQPCFKLNEKYLIHFISSGNKWYGYVYGGTGSYFCNCDQGGDYSELVTNTQQQILNLPSIAIDTIENSLEGIGACCKQGSCEVLPKFLCTGSFAGIGTTCGNTGFGPCDSVLGSCCVNNVTDGKSQIYCIDNVTAYTCLNLQSDSVTTLFTKQKKCSDLNCSNSFNGFGGCCDGLGFCKDEQEIKCITNGGSFLGIGVNCASGDNTPLCSSGFGACCGYTGSCTHATVTDCISNGGLFFGNGTTCSDVTCSTSLSCASYLPFNLKPGDLFGGGIVVGRFQPKTSKVFGAAHAFSRQGITAEFLYGGETLSREYQSVYDYIGYGITGESCISLAQNENADSYYIIASLVPVAVDENNNLVDQTQNSYKTDLFSWYGSGIAWGPLLNLTTYGLDDFTYLNKTYEAEYLKYGEGHYGITGENLDNINSTTLQSCSSSLANGTDPIAKLFAKNIKSSNGLWHRNWGLYNTIRMISADNAHHLQISKSPYFDYTEFNVGLTMTSVHALKLFDNAKYDNSYGLTANPEQLSDWYIPSHDELGFIAINCLSENYNGFNLNAELLANNGIPFDGWYWSSTGSFDETNKLEGIYINSKAKHGSVAWAMHFDVNGNSTNFKVKKEKRSKELKIRPIRAIRCDGKLSNSITQQYKLWKTPNLMRNRP